MPIDDGFSWLGPMTAVTSKFVLIVHISSYSNPYSVVTAVENEKRKTNLIDIKEGSSKNRKALKRVLAIKLKGAWKPKNRSKEQVKGKGNRETNQR